MFRMKLLASMIRKRQEVIYSVLNYKVVHCFLPVFVGMPVVVILVHLQELLLS